MIVGYAIFGAAAFALFAIAGLRPHLPAATGVIIGSTVYGVAFSLIAGSVAASLAPARPLIHAGVVACIIAFGAAAALATRAEQESIWSQLMALLFMAPAVIIGAWLKKR